MADRRCLRLCIPASLTRAGWPSPETAAARGMIRSTAVARRMIRPTAVPRGKIRQCNEAETEKADPLPDWERHLPFLILRPSADLHVFRRSSCLTGGESCPDGTGQCSGGAWAVHAPGFPAGGGLICRVAVISSAFSPILAQPVHLHLSACAVQRPAICVPGLLCQPVICFRCFRHDPICLRSLPSGEAVADLIHVFCRFQWESVLEKCPIWQKF